MPNIIWQYWETKGKKPGYIDGLYQIAKKNSGVEVIQVTPETLSQYVPNIPDELYSIGEIAHKADMIRAMLIYEQGGMWLDSDAIVIKNLQWLFKLLDNYEFVGFNDRGDIKDEKNTDIRINCFLAQPKSNIIGKWVKAQHQKFPRTTYGWTEIGTDLLGPICLENRHCVKTISFEKISPIQWYEVEKFTSKTIDADDLLKNTDIVMLSNQILHDKNMSLTKLTVNQIASGHYLLSDVMKKALGSSYVPPNFFRKLLNILSL